MAPAGWDLFWFGLASGAALLTASAYRAVSPGWLRWLLFGTTALMIGRYTAMATAVATPEMLDRLPLLRHAWYGSAVGLTLPSLLAIDQLVRHPAMSPRKLLTWFSPFLAVYALVLLLGEPGPALAPWLRVLLSVTQAIFVVGYLLLGGLLLGTLPVPALRRALLVLLAAQACLGLDGLAVALGATPVRPFLFSEIAALLALWHAYDTAYAVQTNR